MMNTILKKITALTATLAATGALWAAPVLATPVTDGEATVPVYLTQKATSIDVTIGTNVPPVDPSDPSTLPSDWPADFDESDPSTYPEGYDPTTNNVPIDVDGDGTTDFYGPSSDAIYMYAERNSNIASVTDLIIKNNNASSPVFVKGIAISGLNGYTMNAFNSDFSAFQADSKKIGLSLTGGTTALTTINHDLATAYTSTGDSIAANGTANYTLDGKTAISTTAVNLQQIANCVVTVAMTPEP